MKLAYARPMYSGVLQAVHYLVVDSLGDAKSACGMILSSNGHGGFKMAEWTLYTSLPNCDVCASCADKASKFVKSKLGELPKNWKTPPKVKKAAKTDDHEYFDPQEDLILFQPVRRAKPATDKPESKPVRRNSPVRSPYRPT